MDMAISQYLYSVPPKYASFSVTCGGISNLKSLIKIENQPSYKVPGNRITWTLKEKASDRVFKAHQDISSDHSALYSHIVSEHPLSTDHIYETINVQLPNATPKNGNQIRMQPSETAGYLGIAQGTFVMTNLGEVPVEKLKVGDSVITRDHGIRPICWIGTQTIKKSNPILFKKGAIKNARDLIVSPDHRMVLKGIQAISQFGAKEVLVTAKSMVNDRTIIPVKSDKATYYQILTQQHEIIYIEAVASESFMPDDAALSSLTTHAQDSLSKALHNMNKTTSEYGAPIRVRT